MIPHCHHGNTHSVDAPLSVGNSNSDRSHLRSACRSIAHIRQTFPFLLSDRNEHFSVDFVFGKHPVSVHVTMSLKTTDVPMPSVQTKGDWRSSVGVSVATHKSLIGRLDDARFAVVPRIRTEQTFTAIILKLKKCLLFNNIVTPTAFVFVPNPSN